MSDYQTHEFQKKHKDEARGDIAFGFCLAAMAFMFFVAFFTHSYEDDQRDYLRRMIIRTHQYTPCKNAGFDRAMGVDCGPIAPGAK